MTVRELDEINRNVDLQAILNPDANYGQVLQEKLLRHVEFMIENRRKYYRDLEERSS